MEASATEKGESKGKEGPGLFPFSGKGGISSSSERVQKAAFGRERYPCGGEGKKNDTFKPRKKSSYPNGGGTKLTKEKRSFTAPKKRGIGRANPVRRNLLIAVQTKGESSGVERGTRGLPPQKKNLKEKGKKKKGSAPGRLDHPRQPYGRGQLQEESLVGRQTGRKTGKKNLEKRPARASRGGSREKQAGEEGKPHPTSRNSGGILKGGASSSKKKTLVCLETTEKKGHVPKECQPEAGRGPQLLGSQQIKGKHL